MDDLLKHKGRFTISNDVIHAADTYGSPLYRLFAKMIIVRAECDFMSDSIEYYAYSPMFRPVEDGETVPRYNIIFDSAYANDKISGYFISAVEVEQ